MIDQATLDQYTKGTNLQGRTTIDPSLEGTGKLGVTGPNGRVRISPSAFRSESLLRLVAYHEGVHVSQIASGNWFTGYSRTYGKAVVELEAYRKDLAYQKTLDFDAQLGTAARQSSVDNIADLIYQLDGTAYFEQVTQGHYNYQLRPEDRCPISVCSLR